MMLGIDLGVIPGGNDDLVECGWFDCVIVVCVFVVFCFCGDDW